MLSEERRVHIAETGTSVQNRRSGGVVDVKRCCEVCVKLCLNEAVPSHSLEGLMVLIQQQTKDTTTLTSKRLVSIVIAITIGILHPISEGDLH